MQIVGQSKMLIAFWRRFITYQTKSSKQAEKKMPISSRTDMELIDELKRRWKHAHIILEDSNGVILESTKGKFQTFHNEQQCTMPDHTCIRCEGTGHFNGRVCSKCHGHGRLY